MLRNLLKTAFRNITIKFGYSFMADNFMETAAIANPADSVYEN